jgi:hypothetical protein
VPLDAEESRYAVAYAGNPSAIELLTRILAPNVPPDFAALQYGAAHISPADLWAARNRVETGESRYGRLRGIGELKAALDDAARAGKSFVLVKDQIGVPEADRQTSFREELYHAMQAHLGGGENLNEHLRPSTARFFSNPNARTAWDTLRQNPGYRNASEGQLAAEIGVRLMESGRFQELGLQYNQARDLAAHYLRAPEEIWTRRKPAHRQRSLRRTLPRASSGRRRTWLVAWTPWTRRGRRVSRRSWTVCIRERQRTTGARSI